MNIYAKAPTRYAVKSGDGYVFNADTFEMTTDITEALLMNSSRAAEVADIMQARNGFDAEIIVVSDFED